MSESHVHDFKPVEKTITLRRGVARDTLKQFVCACGKTETVDLKRKLI